MSADRLDSRAWLIWGICAMIPMLISRHPLLVAEMLAIVLAVRLSWAGRLTGGWGWMARVAAVFVLVGVVFNALTVHAGDRVLFRISDDIPLIGGPITLNAIVYGAVSGISILVLVLAGTTVAAGLSFSDLVRSLPARVAPLAVAGSVAWSFLPGASRAFTDIRESQASRGHRLRGVRDIPQLVVPLVEGGMERAVSMAEALEARGFGASAIAQPVARRGQGTASVVFIGALVVGAYGLATGLAWSAAGGFAVAVVALAVLAGAGDHQVVHTRYREVTWSIADRVVVGASLLAVLGFLWRQAALGDAIVFNPYPYLEMPALDLLMVLALGLLLTPAAITPAGGDLR